MNYATQVGKPTAHITKKKSRLKVYNDHIVFLNDKDNFEFEIHNPTNKTVLFKINLNGELTILLVLLCVKLILISLLPYLLIIVKFKNVPTIKFQRN